MGFTPDTQTEVSTGFTPDGSDGFTPDPQEEQASFGGMTKQMAIGLVNEAAMGLPLFALEAFEGEQAREDLESAVGVERVARGVGTTAGFLLGAPAKVFLKGGQMALKGVAKLAPDVIGATAKGALKSGKQLTNAQRLSRSAIQGGGGFGAFEALKAPEDEFTEKALTVPLSVGLGAAFGVAGESIKPAVSRFVSNITKSKKSVFTDELANDLLTHVVCC